MKTQNASAATAPEILNLLNYIDKADGGYLGLSLDATPARAKALKLGLIIKTRRMKVGHSWLYKLTQDGREILKSDAT